MPSSRNSKMAVVLPRRLRKPSLAAAVICFARLALVAFAQHAQTPNLLERPAQEVNSPASVAFEVASVRPVPPAQRGFTELGPYGTSLFSFRNASLANLLQLAFDTDHFTGETKGLDEVFFDVEARTTNNVPLTYETLKPQLQQLLRERFGLVAHIIAKKSPGYALVTAKGGPKLAPAKPNMEAHAYILQDQLQIVGGSLETLATALATVLQCPVVDETSLAGKYNITLKYAPDDSNDSPYPPIFTDLKKQLGLELKYNHVTVNALSIDHIDLSASAN